MGGATATPLKTALRFCGSAKHRAADKEYIPQHHKRHYTPSPQRTLGINLVVLAASRVQRHAAAGCRGRVAPCWGFGGNAPNVPQTPVTSAKRTRNNRCPSLP
jgi:hypothetical protein